MHPSCAIGSASEGPLLDRAQGTLHSLGAALQLTPLHLPARRADLGLGHTVLALLFFINFAGPAQPLACSHTFLRLCKGTTQERKGLKGLWTCHGLGTAPALSCSALCRSISFMGVQGFCCTLFCKVQGKAANQQVQLIDQNLLGKCACSPGRTLLTRTKRMIVTDT